MAGLSDLVEDYATTPVPQAKTYSGVRVGFVLGGIGIALPALLSGAEVGRALGFTQSALAFVVAGALVTALAIAAGWVGMRSRLSTYMILRFSFGRVGAGFVNLTFALAQFGWFGVNAYYFGDAAAAAGREVFSVDWPVHAYILSGGVVMTAATVFGFKALDKMALVVFPLMLTVLALMMARIFADYDLAALNALTGNGSLTFGQSVTVLAGGIIVGVVLVPDLMRYARGPKDVIIAAVIALAIIEPVVHIAASGPALVFGVSQPLAMMSALGLTGIALIFVVMASVSTNAVNLYGSGLALSAVAPRVPEWAYVLIAGVTGTGLALMQVSHLFIDFLVWQSVLFSAVLGVYTIDFFFVRRGVYRLEDLASEPAVSAAAFGAWLAGAVIAALAYQEVIVITGMSSLDGALSAGAAYGAAKYIARRRAPATG